jgi:hypothetical protein
LGAACFSKGMTLPLTFAFTVCLLPLAFCLLPFAFWD